MTIAASTGAAEARPANADASAPLLGTRTFFVGGIIERIENRSVLVGQARVQELLPRRATGRPIILYPGLGLGGAIYLGTPDGRPGWAQDFVNMGHPVYVYDPVDTGPSGIRPGSAAIRYWDIDEIWPRWGFGPSRDVPYVDTRFPVAHVVQFYAAMSARPVMSRSQGTAGANRGAASEPDTTQGRTQQADPNIDPLTHLLRITGPAIVVAHSWASIALEGVVKKNPDLISGMVLLEPATCPTASTINFYAKMPSLMIYGDRITSRGQQQRYNECKAAATQLGKSAQFLDLPAKGVKANGHIMMQEDNSRMLSSEIHQWAKSVQR
jgi:hypothetical protein